MKKRVLVVDDEAPARELLADLLKKEGYAIKTASSAEEALGIIEREDFEVVLLDIKLPGMDGLEALKQIKAKRPLIQAVMITGYGYDAALIERAKKNGCDGYIGKNLPITQIVQDFKSAVKAAKHLKHSIGS